MLQQTSAGKIFRAPICDSKLGDKDLHPGEISFLLDANSVVRRKIASKMSFNWAGKGGPKEIGKPSSAFLAVVSGKLVIDYLVENPSHDRTGEPTLHDFIRRNVNYQHIARRIDGIGVAMSGHIAPLNITTEDVGWIMLFDAFLGPNACEGVSGQVKVVLNCLRESRIVPITSDAYII